MSIQGLRALFYSFVVSIVLWFVLFKALGVV